MRDWTLKKINFYVYPYTNLSGQHFLHFPVWLLFTIILYIQQKSLGQKYKNMGKTFELTLYEIINLIGKCMFVF